MHIIGAHAPAMPGLRLFVTPGIRPALCPVSLVQSDTDGMEPFPIFRRGEAPDYGASHHTVIFDLWTRTMSIYCNARGRPSESEPWKVLKIGESALVEVVEQTIETRL
jgi:hypothetical protein